MTSAIVNIIRFPRTPAGRTMLREYLHGGFAGLETAEQHPWQITDWDQIAVYAEAYLAFRNHHNLGSNNA
jgi:hypothetical protein